MADSYEKNAFLDKTITAAGESDLIGEVFIRPGATDLWIDFENSAHKELDTFIVSIKAHSDANYQTIANSTSDFTLNGQWPIQAVGADMTALGKSESAIISVYVHGLFAVKFEASAATGSDTTLTARYQQR